MNEKEIHLRDYFRIIKKRKYTVVTFFIVTFVVVLISTLSVDPVYQASVKLLVEKSKADPLVAGYRYFAYDPEFLQTQFQIISSTSVAKKVVKILDLEKSYDSYFKDDDKGFSVIDSTRNWVKNIFSLIRSLAGIGRTQPDPDTDRTDSADMSKADRIAKLIKSGIVVEPIMDTRIVMVSFRSPNPVLSQMIVNTIAKAYIEEILEMRMEASGYAIKWMAKKSG